MRRRSRKNLKIDASEVPIWVKIARARAKDGDGERWESSIVCPTLNVFDTCGDSRSVVLVGRDGTRKRVQKAFGINCQSSRMFPCSEEVSQVLSVCHGCGVVTFGFNYLASAESRKPWIKGISPVIKSGRNDACVCLARPAEKSQNKKLEGGSGTLDTQHLNTIGNETPCIVVSRRKKG